MTEGDEPIILFAGRLTPEKGLAFLFFALKRVDSSIRWRLHVAGTGYAEESLRQLCAELGLSQRVSFSGWQNCQQLDELLWSCTIVAFPSVWPEPFGMVGPEAMAHGKPVVAFDVGGVSDWLVHGVTGLLAPPGDVVTLARNIETLLANEALRAKLGASGQKEAFRKYSMVEHLRGLLPVFAQAQTDFRGHAAEVVRHH